MAIKLADVIERSHVSFPVIEAHDKTIVGFYNGASGNAQQPLQLYYNSSVKTKLSSDGSAGNTVKLTSLPYGGDGGTDTAGPTDALVIPTEKGGILTMLDEKLLTDAGGHPSPTDFVSAYLVNVANQGSNVDAARSSIGRLSELAQQFNRYPIVTGQQAVALGDVDGESFLFAGYSTEQKSFKAISFAQMIAGIGAQLTTDLINNGVITDSQASGQSGGIGDVNGDGSVSTADLLEFLTAFGNNSAGFETDYTTLVDTPSDQSVDNIAVGVAPGVSSPFAVSDLSSWNYGSSVNIGGEAYGWTSVSFPTSAANFVRFNTMNLGTGNELLTTHWHARRLVVDISTMVTFDAPDAIYMIVHVILTDASGNANTNELMVVTSGYQDFNSNNNGFFSQGYYGGTAGAPIGVPIPWTPQVDFKTEGFTERYPVATNYENHTSALEEGFMMNYAFSSNFNIKNMEVRIHFAGTNGSTTVDIESVRHRIISV